jgi:hypothetical protein
MPEDKGPITVKREGDKIVITVPADQVEVKDSRKEKVLDFCNCSSVLNAVANFI